VEGEEGRGWEVSGVGNPANSTFNYWRAWKWQKACLFSHDDQFSPVRPSNLLISY